MKEYPSIDVLRIRRAWCRSAVFEQARRFDSAQRPHFRGSAKPWIAHNRDAISMTLNPGHVKQRNSAKDVIVVVVYSGL